MVRLATGSPVRHRNRPAGRPGVRRRSLADALPSIDAATGGELQAGDGVRRDPRAGSTRFFVTPASGADWKRRARGHRRRRQGGRLHDRAAPEARDGGRAGRAGTPDPAGRVPAARPASGARRASRPSPKGSCWRRSASISTRPASASARRRRTDDRRADAGGRRDRRARGGRRSAARFSATPATSRAAFANEPSNVLTPRVFAERAAAISKEAGVARRDPRREGDRDGSGWGCCSASRAAARSRRASS